MASANCYACLLILLATRPVLSQKTCSQGQASGSTVTSALVKSLLASADPNVRPDADYGGPTVVEVDISIQTIEPSSPAGYYHMHGIGIFSWTDPRLAWNPEDFAGIKTVLLPWSGIWQADLVMYNSYGQSPSPKAGGELPFPVNVSYNGVVLQRSIGSMDSRCMVSGASVTCNYLAGAWSSDTNMIVIKPRMPLDTFSLFQTPAILTPVTSSTQAVTLMPGCCSPAGYSVYNLTASFTSNSGDGNTGSATYTITPK